MPDGVEIEFFADDFVNGTILVIRWTIQWHLRTNVHNSGVFLRSRLCCGLIRDYLVQRVEHGAVQSRADVVSALEEVGFEVPRQGKNYVTARDPDSGKRWRLRGALYEHDFQPERLDFPAAQPAGGRPQADGGDGREFEQLGESLSAVASDALRSIEADTAAATARVSVLLRRAWLRSLVVGLSLFLGFSGGRWATMHLSRSIEHRIETLATVNVQIEQARETLFEIEETTWGVTLREIDGERIVVLPAGTLNYPPLTLGGRPAVKLSRE